MSYKLLKITNYYKYYFKYYYDKFPEIKEKSYKEQHSHLMKQYVAWSDFYANALKKQGVEAAEIVYNATAVQNQWAKEKGIEAKGIDILTAQIKDYKPDVLWFQDSFSFDADYMKDLKRIVPSVKLLIGNSCAPYTPKNIENLKIFDFVTTCSPKFVQNFESYGLKTLMLYHAFEPTILPEIASPEKIRDFIFVGSIIPRKDFHIQRKTFLEKLAANPDIDFSYFGNLSNVKYSEVLKLQLLYGAKEVMLKTGASKFFQNSVKFKKMENLNAFPKYFKFSKALQNSYKNELYGIDMFREIARTKITFDIQVEIEGDYAGNMRMFESTGAGACLLLENKINVPDIFEPDKEVVIYNSFDEAMEKIIWLLNNENKLIEIAKAGQKRTLKDHTYDKRATILIKEIDKFMN